MNEQELKTAVTNKLVTEHDFVIEEAEETVEESVSDKPDMWNENADVDSLAKFLASDDEDA